VDDEPQSSQNKTVAEMLASRDPRTREAAEDLRRQFLPELE
jgi:hypothetical protein